MRTLSISRPLIHQQADGRGVQFDPRDGLEAALADGKLQRCELQDALAQSGFQLAFSDQQSVQAAGLPAQRALPANADETSPPPAGAVPVAETRRNSLPAWPAAVDAVEEPGRSRLAQRSLQGEAALVPARDPDVLSQKAAQLRAHIGPVVIDFAAQFGQLPAAEFLDPARGDQPKQARRRRQLLDLQHVPLVVVSLAADQLHLRFAPQFFPRAGRGGQRGSGGRAVDLAGGEDHVFRIAGPADLRHPGLVRRFERSGDGTGQLLVGCLAGRLQPLPDPAQVGAVASACR